MIDGRPLGEYEALVPQSREHRKWFEEIQWAGIALVGCDADLEIRELRSTAPSGIGSTADFEALLVNGTTVTLELARVVVGEDFEQASYYTKLAQYTEQHLQTAAAQASTYLFRAYAGRNIGECEARQAARELAEFIQLYEPLRIRSTTLHPAPNNYAILSQLGVHVCNYDDAGEARVWWDPLRTPIDRQKALEAFQAVFASKQRKVAEYSRDGRPVWLVLGVPPSPFDTFRALSLVQHLKDVPLQIEPFTRLLVGCYTAGVIFSTGTTAATYRSLTTTG